MGQGFIVGKVVDADNLNIGKSFILAGGPEDAPPYPAKTVDAYFDSHSTTPSPDFCKITAFGETVAKIVPQCSFVLCKLRVHKDFALSPPEPVIFF
jgi:hypothetical protein